MRQNLPVQARRRTCTGIDQPSPFWRQNLIEIGLMFFYPRFNYNLSDLQFHPAKEPASG
jgi:hypothetical protein